MSALKIFLLTIFLLLVGCEDKYQKGYENGYLEGVSVTEKKLNEVIELLEEKIKRQERQSTYTSGISSTSVCGGGGVEVNGKHHGAGKTGCVRVYSDGRIEKY
jgi:succinate dehydrogenase/fumarate reductase-like Fe-S protein